LPYLTTGACTLLAQLTTLCLKNVSSLTGYNLNTQYIIYTSTDFYNFWHVSSEDIQKSATGITLSITLFLLNLCWSEAAVTEVIHTV